MTTMTRNWPCMHTGSVSPKSRLIALPPFFHKKTGLDPEDETKKIYNTHPEPASGRTSKLIAAPVPATLLHAPTLLMPQALAP